MKLTLIQKLLQEGKLNTEFVDQQNLISKFSLLELLQKYEKYNCLNSNYETKYYKRIEKSLSFIPKEFHLAAVTLFANAFYVSESMLSDSLVYLYKEVVSAYIRENKFVNSTHMFEVDPSGLTESFFRVNKIEGRLDSSTFSRIKSVSELINSLNNFVSCESLQSNTALIANIYGVLKKKLWILLSDFSFSGTSLVGDYKNLNLLRDLCFSNEKKPHIVICVQLISAKALNIIQKEINNSTDKIYYSQYFGDELRVVPKTVWKEEKILSPKHCLLFEKDKYIYEDILKLCKWFAKEYIDIDPVHKKTKNHCKPKTLAFGYKHCGYTVIPQRNTLSNSLPIFWYTPSQEFKTKFNRDYIPPFPRTISRISQTTGGDKDNINNIIENKQKLQKVLSYSNNLTT